MNEQITVIGGGLAGVEAAFAAANLGAKVTLFEMKGERFSPAHHSMDLAELVCSNSLKAKRLASAAGLMKEEMRRMGSLCISCAEQCEVPAGGALAVDRESFSRLVTEKVMAHPNITLVRKEVTQIPQTPCIIAAGPLASDALSKQISALFGSGLSFYDAAAPIVTLDSIDMSRAFFESRYGKGDGTDYLNCPMNKAEYEVFYEALVNAERAPVHDFDVRDPKVYEGCMPIEVMAQRGHDTIRFGPMKPVGLTDPNTGHRPWAVLQLRKENSNGTMFNMVGFQTNLKFPEQKRVFGLIPALKNAQFVRYGVMHRNTFLDSPRVLNSDYSVKDEPRLFFAGQITGVEGYMESASSGIIAGINAARRLKGESSLELPSTTMLGCLSSYISDESVRDFQPMGANFGIMPELQNRPRDKKERGQAYADRSLNDLKLYLESVRL